MQIKTKSNFYKGIKNSNGVRFFDYNQKGFSLFVAMAVAGALLLVAFAVSKIATKGLEFSNISKESQLAFFAADAGIECALYWDVTFDPSKFDPVVSGSPISCAGVSMATGPGNPLPDGSGNMQIGAAAVSRFGFVMNQGVNQTNACVVVVITKAGINTRIQSYGYNTCDTTFGRRVERGVEVTY